MNLTTYKKELDRRHDFDDDDLAVLSERHPNVKFVNIPTAWIIPIDEMLCRFRYNPVVKSVEQHFGQLCVSFVGNAKDKMHKYKKIVAGCELKIKAIDIDLNL